MLGMKKFIVCILAFLYIASSTGATIHMHYCMGKLVEKGLWHGNAKKCGSCSAKDNNSACNKKCCKDEHKLVKLDKDQKTAESVIQLLAFASLAAPVNFTEIPQVQIASNTQEYPVNNGPPGSYKVQPYIFLCTFRI